ncbi:MAG: hypothetical protein HZB51_21620 [Chloroflexi bacterium]|nr:hypothetical protein [Chloroflexota bacterium]
MLFPKGQPVYENLNTSFAQLDAMLAELKSTQFTGYVHLTAWEYDGILLIDTGSIVNAVEEVKKQRRHGPDAAEGIAVKAKEKDGALNVYRLSAELTQLLASLFDSDPIYKDLSSDLTGLDKLLAKLQTEKHTGYIQIHMTKSKSAASIYLRDGQVLDSALFSQGVLISGPKTLDDIILMTGDEHSSFNVFRSDLAQAYSHQVNLADSFVRQEMINLWQDVLRQFETTLAEKSGAFITSFKRACITQATSYPFLDPFAAELEYKDGVLKFEGQASVAQFNEGLCKTLAQTVRDLASHPASKTWMNNLRPALAQVKNQYGNRLEQVGLTTHLPDLFGS